MEMARFLPRSVTNVRQVLLALLAIGLVLRLGGACEAMAAVPQPAAAQSHCADMPAHPGKPVKGETVSCAVFAPMPASCGDAVPTEIVIAAAIPARPEAIRLAGLTSGPAPPPPRAA